MDPITVNFIGVWDPLLKLLKEWVSLGTIKEMHQTLRVYIHVSHDIV